MKAESLPLVIFFYVVRGSFMNAAGPINQASAVDLRPHPYLYVRDVTRGRARMDVRTLRL